jgi:hypothetical protein
MFIGDGWNWVKRGFESQSEITLQQRQKSAFFAIDSAAVSQLCTNRSWLCQYVARKPTFAEFHRRSL